MLRLVALVDPRSNLFPHGVQIIRFEGDNFARDWG